MRHQFRIGIAAALPTVRSFVHKGAIAYLAALYCTVLSAQSLTVGNAAGSTPPSIQGGAPAGAYAISDLEHINLYNGNLNFAVPLYHVAGRGEAQFTLTLPLERRWHAVYEPSFNWVRPYDTFWYAQLPAYAPGLLISREVGADRLSCPPPPGTITFDHVQRTVTRLSFVAADGTETEFRDQLFTGQPQFNFCSGNGVSRGTIFVSDDGSSATFVSDSAIFDAPLPLTAGDNQSYPSGNLSWRDGTRYRIVNGMVTSIRDRNGNVITFNYDQLVPNAGVVTSIVDSLNRRVTFSYMNSSLPSRDDITYTGFGGVPRTISVYRDLISHRLKPGWAPENYNQLFPELSGSSGFPYDRIVPSVVQLPDGRQYQFLYNSYGELARVALPTGGAFEYDFMPAGTNGTNVIGSFPSQEIYRRLRERRVYPDGVNLEGRTVYSPSYFGSTSADFQTNIREDSLDVSNNLLASSVHVFYGNPFAPQAFNSPLGFFSWKEGRETQTQFYDAGGSRVLRTVDYGLAQKAFLPWWTDSQDISPPNDPRTIFEVVVLDTNEISRRDYSYDNFNNVNDVFESDSGQNAPGPLLRHRHTDYLISNLNTDYTSPFGPHLRNLPTQILVYQPGGNGDTLVAATYFIYDQDFPQDRPGISGLDPGFGPSYRTRGNPGSVSRWLNTTNALLPRFYQYDIAGNVTTVIDENGFTTSNDYSDRFGFPDGEATSNFAPSELGSSRSFAFRTATTNPLGQTAYFQYDYHLGRVVDSQDLNGTVDSSYFNDPLDRTTQLIRANNRSGVTTAGTVKYIDSIHTITTTSDQTAFGDGLIRADLLYDGLGRTIETRQFENGGGYISTRHQFDGLGRVSATFNPARAGDPPVQTVTQYDGLNRITSVIHSDNAVTFQQYSGRQTTYIDPANKTRVGTVDGLGRLTQVQENNGIAYFTSYRYDALDNLTQVSQSGEARFFNYDSLSRLTTAFHPESGGKSFTYDSNGNTVRIVDARNVTTNITYDRLNRINQKSYTDNTPTVTYTYDDPNIANSIGHLTRVSSSATIQSYGPFDPLGRVLQSKQTTNSQDYSFQYGYDLAGELVTEKYPSGRLVSMNYDAAGRLASVASAVRAYAGNFQYAPHGAVSAVQLGNGLWERTTFNTRLQPTRIALGSINSDSSVLGLSFGFTGSGNDNNGNVRSQTISAPGLGQSLVQTYSYDGVNRIQQATESQGAGQTWQQTYDYDPFGNRAVRNTSYIPLPALTPQALSEYDGNNRWHGANYDNAGNIASDAFQTYQYDAENRQTSVSILNSGTATYAYDGEGHRVLKAYIGLNTVYVYDVFDRLIAEYSNQSSPTATEFPTTDHLGNLRAVTDGSGNIQSRHDYLPFGEELAASLGDRGSATGYLLPDYLSQRFTGKERDAESGLDNFLARYYTPHRGTFQSADPALSHVASMNPQLWNSYGYVGNNPLRLIDPNGHSPIEPRGPEVPPSPRGRLAVVQTRGPAIKPMQTSSLKAVSVRTPTQVMNKTVSQPVASGRVNPIIIAKEFFATAAQGATIGGFSEDFLTGVYSGAVYSLKTYGFKLPEFEGSLKGGIASELAGNKLYGSLGKGIVVGVAEHYALDYIFSEGGKVPVSDVPFWSSLPFIGPFFEAAPSAGEVIDTRGACSINGHPC
jgi:RHS repeat-associated protein